MSEAKVVIPITFWFNSPIWPLQKTAGIYRMTADYYKVNQVVTPTEVAIPVMVGFIAGANQYISWHLVIDRSWVGLTNHLQFPWKICTMLLETQQELKKAFSAFVCEYISLSLFCLAHPRNSTIMYLNRKHRLIYNRHFYAQLIIRFCYTLIISFCFWFM